MKYTLLTLIIVTMFFRTGSAQSNKVVADSFYENKQYSEAIPYYKNALSETTEGDKINILLKIIHCYDELSEYANSVEYTRQSLKFIKKIYGIESSEYGYALWYLCSRYFILKNYAESIMYGKKSIAVFNTRLLADEEIMTCYKYVGLSLFNQDSYCEAIYHLASYSKYAIKYYNNHESMEYANSLWYLGLAYYSVGNYAKSIEYHNNAANIFLKKEGEQSEMYNKCLSAIADAYALSPNNKNRSFEYSLKCYSLNKKYGNDSTFAWVTSIRSVGHAYHCAGNEDEAIKYYNEALEQHMKIYGKIACEDYIFLGRAYRGKGDLNKSMEYLLKAEELYISEFDKTNTLLAYNLAQGYFIKGEYQKAYENIKNDCKSLTIKLYEEFPNMASDSRTGRWNIISEDYDMLLKASIEVNTPESRTEAYNSLLLSKGILLSTEQQLQDVVANSNNDRLVDVFNKLKDTKNKIIKISDNNPKAIDSLKILVDSYESEIMQYSYLYGDIVRNLKIDVEDVRLNLDSNDVAIEFFFTEHGKFGALVMKRDFKHPELVMLKDSTYEGIMKDGKLNKNSAYHGLGLYNNIWKPLEKYFNKNGNIYFSPSGKLHTLAIEYAPISDSLLISNKYRIHRVSSTRYLALNSSHEMSKRAVIYGGIKYDTDINNMLTQSKGYSHSLSELLVSRQYLPMGGNFSANYLPGTLREANAIDSILYGKKFTTKLVTGSEANEESFKNLSGVNYDILHIATHGYCEKNSNMHGDNALELSGLLFSGCNNASKVSSEIEDGVLSAKEISLLDFRNVDMVVMSACETGLGEISNEGVFGLQRGFKKAGANTIVMSLWPVSDKATMIWMTKFYENLASGMKKQEAFSKAQQELRKQFRHPAFWAAFIMLDGE